MFFAGCPGALWPGIGLPLVLAFLSFSCRVEDGASISQEPVVSGEGPGSVVASPLVVGGCECPSWSPGVTCGELSFGDVPDDDIYYITTFGGPNEGQDMWICGHQKTDNGSWAYIAGYERFGCHTKVRISHPTSGKSCIGVVADCGPNKCVEQAASFSECRDHFPILDVSPFITQYIFGITQSGWSEKRKVTGTVVHPDSVAGCPGEEFEEPTDPCIPSEEVCNGLDDDCNGLTDEGVCVACVPGRIDDCTTVDGAAGLRECGPEAWWGRCIPVVAQDAWTADDGQDSAGDAADDMVAARDANDGDAADGTSDPDRPDPGAVVEDSSRIPEKPVETADPGLKNDAAKPWLDDGAGGSTGTGAGCAFGVAALPGGWVLLFALLLVLGACRGGQSAGPGASSVGTDRPSPGQVESTSGPGEATGIPAGNVSQHRLVNVRRIDVEGDFIAPRFSPDGSRLMLAGPKYAGLWVVGIAGGVPRQVTDEPGIGWGAAWEVGGIRARTRDGRGVFFREAGTAWERLGGAEVPGQPARPGGLEVRVVDDVVRVKRDGREASIDAGDDRFYGPVVSADGTAVAFEGLSTGIHVHEFSTGNTRAVGPGNHPSWLPDSGSLVFGRTRDDGHELVAGDLWIWNRSDGKLQQLTHTPDLIARRPSVSPDGRFIEFETRDGIHGAELARIIHDGP
jgi:hypothetical protein